ncbi:hypothetical protein A3K48_06325 [candidate division WOR-1 bacterium RIFOXYA12_FULL_52_29]|uniref:DUF4352 domain-containing protein n=1 Tax=candidate division WOR-1 bacterium RIFOXYC12_FULL_54_18 TaxID=1802584 RepID=A0A1F4T736_UNCSA|nr:MAG: hypothetical protein A3K44_06325 [candidate division WOR-1 bacterium RIFOXYA2_FULL_51_19]OGC18145.1 MAG: hypothetical protein A3K48_06325 [candidate division WOR-1 bacterium RIFOXYA12_FULL_52_29]OGC27000.1 MAG: hypothetical protein A3K32_06320 [candidate division WOR-1 bacterium RIFOXYB2_FULL_45_9]OGC28562.1 MAG: hypothetical protein A3K49_06325 [candidate division WOR-1 bacterium RIFOXYC12_FULL_54_18]OGC30983.1 MAG: hypothetical protein A2346_06295 [candidate division WOR-1 bacterium R
MKIGKVWGLLLIAVVLVGFQFNAEAEKKKIVPAGGRNQLQGLQGKVGEWLANGTSKFKVISFEYPEAGPNGEKAGSGKKYIAIEVELVNNQKFTTSYGGPNGSLNLVDKDEQLFTTVYNVQKEDWRKREPSKRLLPGASLKVFYLAIVPQEYFPVRLVYVPGTKVPVYRINLTDEATPIASESQTKLQGREGKINEWLFNGTTKFKVYSVSYPETDPLGAKAPTGRKWVLVEVEIRNAHKYTSSFGGPNCVLTLIDQKGEAFDKVYHVKKADWRKREGPTRLIPAAGLKAWYASAINDDYLPIKMTFLTEPKVPLFEVDLQTK